MMRRILGNRKGTTLTSVLVAFAVLMIMAGLFYQSVQLALNLIDRADGRRGGVNDALLEFYEENGNPGKNVTQLFSGSNGDFEIRMKERAETYGSEDIVFYSFGKLN